MIAVAQKVQLGDTGESEFTLVSLELFESGFIANFRLRGWGPGSNPDDDPDQPNINRAPDTKRPAIKPSISALVRTTSFTM